MVGVEVVLGTCSGLWGEERVANDNGGRVVKMRRSEMAVTSKEVENCTGRYLSSDFLRSTFSRLFLESLPESCFRIDVRGSLSQPAR